MRTTIYGNSADFIKQFKIQDITILAGETLVAIIPPSGGLRMSRFDAMNNFQLRAYVLANRQDEEAWYVFRARIQEDPNTIRVMPNLNEAGWVEIERKIQEQANRDRL